MLSISTVHLNFETEEKNIRLLRESVSDKRCCKADKYLRKEDMLRSLVGECLCRAMIAESFNLSHNSLEFSASDLGKPFLSECSSIHFNITHSGNWVGCAVSNAPVGIDIERHKSMNTDIAERFFSVEETEFIKERADEYTERFFRIWTLKESYIKAIGKGLHCPLNSFSVISNNMIKQYVTNGEVGKLNIRTIAIADHYSGAVCFVGNKDSFPDISIYTIETLLQRLTF